MDEPFQDINTFSLNSECEFKCGILKNCKKRLTKRGGFLKL